MAAYFRGRGPGLRPAQAGQQLGHGRGRRAPERRGTATSPTAPVTAAQLAGLIGRISRRHHQQQRRQAGVRRAVGRRSLARRCAGRCLIEAKGLKQMNDSGALEAIIDEVLAANEKNVGRVPRRQGKGLQRAGRPGHEGQQGQGQPGPGQRGPESPPGLTRHDSPSCAGLLSRPDAGWRRLQRPAGAQSWRSRTSSSSKRCSMRARSRSWAASWADCKARWRTFSCSSCLSPAGARPCFWR